MGETTVPTSTYARQGVRWSRHWLIGKFAAISTVRELEPRVRWLEPAAWSLGALLAFLCYLRISQTVATNSDGASQALQAWDMLHGNLLLHGWQLSDVSFYTTELPEYMLVELLRGLNADVVHVASAMTYTMVVVLAALLARSTATGRAALARVLVTAGIMIAPQLASGVSIVLSSPDHFGTSVPVLAVWLILDRARPRWYVPVLAAVLLASAVVADQLVLLIGVLPLVVVSATRLYQSVVIERHPLKRQRYDLALLAAAVTAAAAADVAYKILRASGGYLLHPPPDQFLAGQLIPRSLSVTGEGLLLLGGADFLGHQVSLGAVVLLLHLAGVILAGLGTWVAAKRFLRDRNLVDQLLVVAIAANLAAYVVSTRAYGIAGTREIAPVLPFAAVLAGRLLAERFLAARLAPALVVVLAGYLAGLSYSVVQPPAPIQDQQLISWLTAEHLTSGLGGYWQSNYVTLATSNRIRIRSLSFSAAHGLPTGEPGPNAKLVPTVWDTNLQWYDPRTQSADFVVLGGPPGSARFADKSLVLATFGPPARSSHIGMYEVLVWNKNLLADLP
jgi:hypothetical protein